MLNKNLTVFQINIINLKTWWRNRHRKHDINETTSASCFYSLQHWTVGTFSFFFSFGVVKCRTAVFILICSLQFSSLGHHHNLLCSHPIFISLCSVCNQFMAPALYIYWNSVIFSFRHVYAPLLSVSTQLWLTYSSLQSSFSLQGRGLFSQSV